MSNYVGLPHKGAWLVYLNGIEVPCSSVSVNYGVGMIPEASLSFPPHRLLHRLGAEDRIEAVVFYLDDLATPTKPEFRLLFEGELIGWSYTSSSSGRQMTFNAVADISVFTQLYFFFLNNVDAITSFIAQKSDVAGVAQAGAVYPFSLFKKGLIFNTAPSATDQPPTDITRPFEILYNVVRGMLDSNISSNLRAVPAVNFFARWARKRNFVNRFAALPIFEDNVVDTDKGVFPIFKAAQATTAMEAMQKNLSQTIGNAGSLWEVLQEVFGHVLFEVAMLPTAPCARVRLSDGTIVGPGVVSPPQDKELQSKLKAKGEAVSSIVDPKEPVRLINYFVKPQMFFGIAPTCNVMFPSMISNYSYSESYVAQPTRTYVNDQFIGGILPQNVMTTAALTFGFPDEVGAVLKSKMGDPQAAANAAALAAGKPASVITQTRNISKSGKNMLVFPEEFFKGPVVHRMPVPPWFTYLKNMEPPTSSNVSTQPSPEDIEESRSLGVLMASYVEWEHFRSRYEKRGGAVNMAWNPYVVPGFPCVIFDQKASAFHTVGYLNNVQQHLSRDGMSTAVNYTMSRTVPEMLELLQADLIRNPGKIFGSSPLEPVEPVRDVIQDFTKAEQFYNALFFLRVPMEKGKKASFDFREVIGYAKEDGGVEPITLTAVTAESSTVGGVNNVSSTTTSVTNLVGDRAVVPLPGFDPVFNQYDTAMRYIARPICSITDYVSFLHGGAPLQDLLTSDTDVDGVVTKPQVVAGDKRFGDVVYFKRIKRLIQGPGPRPSPAEMGVTVDGKNSAEYDGNPSGLVSTAQTRADWDTALEAYRSEMYSRKGPQQ